MVMVIANGYEVPRQNNRLISPSKWSMVLSTAALLALTFLIFLGHYTSPIASSLALHTSPHFTKPVHHARRLGAASPHLPNLHRQSAPSVAGANSRSALAAADAESLQTVAGFPTLLPAAIAAGTAALGLTFLAAVARAIRTTGFVVAERIEDSADASTRLQTAAALFAEDKRPVILFDGVCNLCNTGVNFVLDWDPPGHLRFAALQSVEGRALLQRHGRSPDDISSIVLATETECYLKSDAVLRIGLQLPRGPWRPLAAAGLLVPRVLRDALYDQVARNRYRLFGRTPSCRLSTEGFADRFVTPVPQDSAP